tara:strand:+ start:649 stop:1653 length:1005 start_codon:yes stop_codon:yes gene_type:complete
MGSEVGVHCGDTVGARFEKTYSPRQIAKEIKDQNGLHMIDYDNPWGLQKNDRNGLRLPAGRPTDDSDQTADLSFSLIKCNGLNTDHLREALRDSVVYGKSRLWDGQATGSGTTTRNALTSDAKTSKINGVPMNNIGTNGSLMRCAPMALWLAPSIMDISNGGTFDPQKVGAAKKLVEDMSSVTHDHPHSKQACWIYTMVLSSLLAGNDPVSALGDIDDLDPSIKKDPLAIRIGSRLNDPYDFPYDPGAWPMRGTAEFSLYVALYALSNTKSFEEGIELAVRVGGDTDTYAAIAGGLLGAHYGYDAIPKEWRETILGHDVMVDYAQKLYDMRLYK